MRNSIFDISNYIEMIMSNQETSCESRIEKMRKFLSSPLTRKKPSGSQTKTFGTSLDVLIQRTPSESSVPFIVTRICQYIENTGLMQEGLFRISGNARLIERLKLCFDQSGDAPLETEGDVASAAALLKLFLRELPDPLIPLNLHQQFLNAVKGSNHEESVSQLMLLVEKLPFANFNLLKYLSYFLMQVSRFEEQNRMSASSLGIVFGPNLFRVAEDFGGLKEQSLTNQIVTYFITDYYTIFHTEPENLTKLNYLSVSLDEGIKASTVAMGANSSMVSSWPKLSSYPSLMSSLNLRPLSVSIPAMDDYPLGSLAENIDSDEHILIVNSSASEDQQVPLNEQASDQSEKEETSAGTLSRRKRKEQKLLKEDVLASYSTLESMLEMSTKPSAEDLDVFMEEKSILSDASDFQARSRGIADGLTKSSKDHLAHMGSQLKNDTVVGEIPKSPKFREQSGSYSDTKSFHFDSLSKAGSQGSAYSDRMQEACPQQNQNIGSLPRRSVAQSLDTAGYCEAAVMSSGHDVFQEEAQVPLCTPQADYRTCAKSSDSYHLDYSEVGVQAEAHEPPLPSSSAHPAAEKRFAHDTKLRRHRRGHRYYKKQHDSSGSTKVSRQQHHHHESQSAQSDAFVENGHEAESQELDDSTFLKDSFPPPHNLDVIPSIDTSPPNGSSTDQRYSWSLMQRLQEEEMSTLSPVHEFLRVSSSAEAPLSPSAYRSYLSHRSPHLDPNLPPSPPVEQEDLATGVVDDANKATVKQLSKKIQTLKSKIKQFEENFEATHGYRPSYAEKSSYSDVKKLISDLSLARRELKELKEESATAAADGLPTTQRWVPPEERFSTPASKTSKRKNSCRFGLCLGPVLTDSDSVTIEESLNEALTYLEEKRKSSGRPESLEEMTRDQLVEEKYTIQKLLLQFEGIHGRPTTKMHRDLMRPLYDRYRSLKRILGRSASFGSSSKLKDSVELQPILEHETMDFGSVISRNLQMKEEEEAAGVEKSENEVHKEINEEHVQPSVGWCPPDSNIKDLSEPVQRNSGNLPIHELSLSELYEQQQQARTEKRRLRKILKEFETQFQNEHGRKVQREDKREMETVYGAYKNVRARLKLLEALAAKQGQKKPV